MAKRRRRHLPPRAADMRKPARASSGLLGAVALILFAGVTVSWNDLSAPFLLDDQLSIVGNEQIRHLSRLAAVLSPQRATPVAGRPLVNLSFALNYAIGGLDVRVYHWPDSKWQVASVVGCAAGMACKESMVTAPVVVALYDRVFLFRSAREAVSSRWRLYEELAITWLVLAGLMLRAPGPIRLGFHWGPQRGRTCSIRR
jgi:hypothetical protein